MTFERKAINKIIEILEPYGKIGGAIYWENPVFLGRASSVYPIFGHTAPPIF
jgi:hypothetical protein